MKRPFTLVIGLAAAALLIAAIGASAHTGFSIFKTAGVHQTQMDEASGARTESPEPAESPEASPSPEPTEKPEPSPTAEPTEAPDNEQGDNEQGDNDEQGDHEGGGSGD
jgi:outer membrane biosynthesis protein TonB